MVERRAEQIQKLVIKDFPQGEISRAWVHVINNGLGEPVRVPIIVAKGKKEGPTIGLTAAIHGNELNGIPVIQRIFDQLDVSNLAGNIVGVFVLNVPGVLMGQRKFNDGTDLNRIAPGSENGNKSQIYVHRLIEKIIHEFDYLIDLHTASFGRVNSYYVRANMSDEVTAKMARLQGADIILNNEASDTSLRGTAEQMGIKSITVELKDPNRFQFDVIKEAEEGIQNILCHLGFIQGEISYDVTTSILCKNSYWLYTDTGGVLQVIKSPLEYIKKGEKIAFVKSIFGDVTQKFYAKDNGIVIGKSINPINQTGSRILHLGLEPKEISLSE